MTEKEPPCQLIKAGLREPATRCALGHLPADWQWLRHQVTSESSWTVQDQLEGPLFLLQRTGVHSQSRSPGSLAAAWPSWGNGTWWRQRLGSEVFNV